MNKQIDMIAQYNNPNFNVDKAIEELGELTTALMQRRTKPDGREDNEIIDEIGDVMIRCKILSRQYGKEAVKQRIHKKLDKMLRNIKLSKYQNV